MQPGDSISLTIFRKTVAGLPSTGKVTADFTVGAWLDGVVASVSAAITEIGSGGADAQAYKLAMTVPATKGVLALRITPASGTDLCWPDFAGEIESNDLDAIYGVIAAPIVSVVSAGGPQGDIQIRIVESDYAPVSFTVKDQTGTGIDLSGYNNAHFRAWNKLQSGSAYDLSTGITMTAAGLVTIGIPESATFYASFGPDPTTGTDDATLYWQFTADQAADATKTRTLARGTMTVLRKES